MFNWFDLVRQAQTKAGLDALTQQFGLSGDQTQKAMAAFLPAFAMGLQHAAMTNDPGRFFQSMIGGGYQNFWQSAARSFSPQAQQQGRTLLDQIFGSDQVSRRVAHQAADYAGVSADTMQHMLPLMAGILAGSMSQWMTAQAQAMQGLASPAASPSADQATASQAAANQASANPWADLWAGWMKTAEPEKKAPSNPFEDMMAAFVPSPPTPEPPKPASSPSWDEMMAQGREMQSQYLASLQSIFEEAWKGESKKS
jgi:hypothetical protein